MAQVMTKKYRSPDQSKLKIICDDVCDNIEVLLDHFGIEFKNNGKMISMSCPIHGGDNDSALNIYPEGETYRGNWKCRSHGCENEFKSSVIGFIRGIISHQKYGWNQPGDKSCSFQEALEYCLAFIKKDIKDIKVSNIQKNKQAFTNIVNYISAGPNLPVVSKISRKQVITSISIPSKYYLNRGYSKEILTKYDVGLCTNPNKPLYNRVIVPVYNNDYEYMVGCTARSIHDKCSSCDCYHDPSMSCPNKDIRHRYPKWKHSTGFKSQNNLYNFWFAKKYIMETNSVILVESPGNVWRLEEAGIHNSVAMFGSSLSDRQKIILDSSGAMHLIILTDNDEAGKKAAEQITAKCQNTYKIFTPTITSNDIGEMTIKQINQELVPQIERVL